MIFHKIYENKLLRSVRKGAIPHHIAIIMDGNRRFARKKGLEPHEGHFFGSKKTEEVLEWCWDLGVKMLTLYAFSTENFRRSEKEKKNIFQLLESELRRLLKDRRTYERELRVKVVGKRELLPENLRETIKEVEERTKKHRRHYLNVAVAYGGRQEIIDAVRAILRKVRKGEVRPEEIDEKMLEEHLYGEGRYSKVDLIIRTGGEQRLSNFLPWQAANSVAYFCDVYWPEFRKIDLLRAIRAWQYRKSHEVV
ncbi:polyprenyl diphosphate synthase [Archaeoglobus fulgidus]|uniref:Tritrans,polycis-undecaprenyl-diphosphate synthase (geranylgeranyl-diphosphate specific) n=1 Tax=Archaeoglobus fulgidus DSM 8774 TaxID=1344584 RepID=A0A075WKM5_ARCFL|nr:polyprenyl diphosphate synthase [Archaeoglobus fulgidus]AIG98093.1 undecaprenyl diphosphate synthase [Archaeoglobus fulgidus DSM 8774]